MLPTTAVLKGVEVPGRHEPVDSHGEGPSTRKEKNPGNREPKNLSDVDHPGDGSSPGQNLGNPKVDVNRELKGQTDVPKKQDVESPGDDLCAEFYDHYHREAGEYDTEFMKKHKGDIESTLIFAGLFSAVTSAFIVAVNSELKPGSDGETAALLRAILYNMNQTAFAGQDAPTVPQQWTGPPQATVQVQAILYASLLASLLSAFLAMLGKQWLSQYASVDIRGSIIERSQNRQRKLDGIDSWYFDYVMKSLPLMLQAALLLFGCALSRYLWEIDTMVALVVVGVTSFGVLFYLFIVVAGATFESCPYQTPGAHTLRHIADIFRRALKVLGYIPDNLHRIPSLLHYILGNLRHIPKVPGYILDILHRLPKIFRNISHIPGRLHSALDRMSIIYRASFLVWIWLKEALHPTNIPAAPTNSPATPTNITAAPTNITAAPANISATQFNVNVARFNVNAARFNIPASLLLILLLPVWSILDACRAVVWLFAIPSNWVHIRSQGRLDPQMVQRCLLWTLRTSLDEPVRLSALNYLATVMSADFDPALGVVCFNILFGCIKLDDSQRATTTQGFDKLVTPSALGCLHILPHLMTAPRVLKEPCHRYTKVFRRGTDFRDLPVSHTLDAMGSVLHPPESRQHISWLDYSPSSNEHIIVARALVKISQFKCQREREGEGEREGERKRHRKVPRWLLRFALHSLSRSPPPPTSVVIDCLSIIAIDLGLATVALDESTPLDTISNQITKGLEEMAQAANPNSIPTDLDPIPTDLDPIPADPNLIPVDPNLIPANPNPIPTDLDPIRSKRKAISALIPYAVYLARCGQQGMADAFLRVAGGSNPKSGEFMWCHIAPCIIPLLDEPTIPSLNSIFMLASPYIHWHNNMDKHIVTRWAAIALETPHTEVFGQSVVDAMLQIAACDGLLSTIPDDIWNWLENLPSLPPRCRGRFEGTRGGVVQHVQKYGSRILKPYLLLVWSEWNSIYPSGFIEMRILIGTHFSGAKRRRDRKDLIERLKYVLGQLDQGLKHLRPHKPDIGEDIQFAERQYKDIQLAKKQYEQLKELLEAKKK